MRCLTASVFLLGSLVATNASAAEEQTREEPKSLRDNGDLFPRAGRPTVAAGTGLPFFGIAELGIGITDNFAIGAVGGVTPSVETAGIRPRVRIPTSERTALVINAPMLWYPKASAPGPGNIGNSSWVLTRTELFLDGAIGDRWHVAGGMGFVAAASLEALGQFFSGKEFAMPAYDGSKETRKGFAGGIWNTVAARGSYTLLKDTHLFAESTLVLEGYKPADGVGGPPIVVTMGVQHAF